MERHVPTALGVPLPVAQRPCPYHEQIVLGQNETLGQLGGLAADVAKVVRSQHRSSIGQWVIGTVVLPLAVAAIGWITTVQVARIGTVKSAQSDYSSEQQRQREQREIESRIETKLNELDTKLEQQRRGYPQPLASREVVTGQQQNLR